MTRLRIALCTALLLASTTGCATAADHEFNALVGTLSHRYHAHPTRVPMMAFVSLCARVATHGGVKGLHVAEFEHLSAPLDLPELTTVVRENLNPNWQPFVAERSGEGNDQSVIFVRPVGRSMRMMIANYDHGELDLVRMELNGDALAQWMKNPDSQARHR